MLNSNEERLRKLARSDSERPSANKVSALRSALDESDKARKALLLQITALRKDKREMKQMIEAKNEQIKNLLLQCKPIEVALTLPLTWEQGDILPEDLVNQRLEEVIAAYPEEERDKARDIAYKIPQFYGRQLIAQDRAWEFAQERGWINKDSYRPSQGKFIILRRIEEEYGYQSALAMAKEFDMPTDDFSYPEYMWDSLCTKRVSPNMVLGIFGDDRSYPEGEYFLCLGYCCQEVDEVWFPDLGYCGVF